jgi:hypothetical protein
MRSRPVRLLWSVLVLLVPAAAPAAEGKAPAPNLPRLVADLGSDDFARREQATRALDALGAPALDELRRAAAGDDAEVRRRARELVEKIERRVETARLLQPRRVHLIYKDTPVADAVADFARQTGFAIELVGDRAKLNDRKVTLDTGPVPFWEAFDQLCRKAGLVEPALLPGSGDGRSPQEEQPVWANPYQPYGAGYAPPGRLTLADGEAPALPTFLAGALRVRLLPPHVPVSVQYLGDGEKVVPLEVTPEPGLSWHGVLSLHVTRAVDDRGQVLTQPAAYLGDGGDMAMNPYGGMVIWDGSGYYNPYGNPGSDPRRVPVRLKTGDRPARQVKELHGTITALAQTPPEPLLEVDNVLKAAGQSVRGVRGGSLKVVAVNAEKDGQVKVEVQVQPPGQDVGDVPVAMGGIGGRFFRINRAVMMMRGGIEAPADPGTLELLDARGQPFERLDGAAQGRGNPGNGGPQTYELIFRPHPGQAEAARLVYSARRTVTLEVPFMLKDVPLP